MSSLPHFNNIMEAAFRRGLAPHSRHHHAAVASICTLLFASSPSPNAAFAFSHQRVSSTVHRHSHRSSTSSSVPTGFVGVKPSPRTRISLATPPHRDIAHAPHAMADSPTPPPPRPVVICGPSGVGKGTLIELLQKHFPPNKFGFSVSHTTRQPREGEEDGTHYHFSTVDEMKREIDAGKFVEHAEVHGNYYGTSVKSVESVQQQNLICLLDIDIQGARNVKKSALDARYLFIAPPSVAELEKRLRGRRTESEEAMQRRLANAQGELEYGLREGNFDAVVVNRDVGAALREMVGEFEGWFPESLTAGARQESGK